MELQFKNIKRGRSEEETGRLMIIKSEEEEIKIDAANSVARRGYIVGLPTLRIILL
jgi:hypothetical protein